MLSTLLDDDDQSAPCGALLEIDDAEAFQLVELWRRMGVSWVRSSWRASGDVLPRLNSAARDESGLERHGARSNGGLVSLTWSRREPLMLAAASLDGVPVDDGYAEWLDALGVVALGTFPFVLGHDYSPRVLVAFQFAAGADDAAGVQPVARVVHRLGILACRLGGDPAKLAQSVGGGDTPPLDRLGASPCELSVRAGGGAGYFPVWGTAVTSSSSDEDERQASCARISSAGASAESRTSGRAANADDVDHQVASGAGARAHAAQHGPASAPPQVPASDSSESKQQSNRRGPTGPGAQHRRPKINLLTVCAFPMPDGSLECRRVRASAPPRVQVAPCVDHPPATAASGSSGDEQPRRARTVPSTYIGSRCTQAAAQLRPGAHPFVRCVGERFLRVGTASAPFGQASGHPLLAGEGPVLYAGEVEIGENGEVLRWNNMSGCYRPDPEHAHIALLPYARFWRIVATSRDLRLLLSAGGTATLGEETAMQLAGELVPRVAHASVADVPDGDGGPGAGGAAAMSEGAGGSGAQGGGERGALRSQLWLVKASVWDQATAAAGGGEPSATRGGAQGGTRREFLEAIGRSPYLARRWKMGLPMDAKLVRQACEAAGAGALATLHDEFPPISPMHTSASWRRAKAKSLPSSPLAYGTQAEARALWARRPAALAWVCALVAIAGSSVLVLLRRRRS